MTVNTASPNTCSSSESSITYGFFIALIQTPLTNSVFPREATGYTADVNALIHRRDFLAAASLALATPFQTLQAAEPSAQFPTDPAHRLSVSTYPFRSVIASPNRPQANKSGAPKMTLAQFAATIVEKFHVYGIEPWSSHFESPEPAFIRQLHQQFQDAGVRVVNIPCDVRVQPCGTSEQKAATQESWQKWVEAAIILESPSIRVHAAVAPGAPPDDLACAVESLKAIAAYGATKNIVINLENDNPKGENPERILKVIEAVNSPFLRSLPDFCNSMQIHDDQEYNANALTKLFPHAFNISHCKDVEIVGGKELRVDMNRIFAIAKKSGYRGFFSMETEGSLDPYAGTSNLITVALKNLS
jgi:sugar phosphate isomerase/epimerase